MDLDREVVRVHGKGNEIREVPVKGATLEAIRAWLGRRNAEPGSLVCPVGKSGKVDWGRRSWHETCYSWGARARDGSETGSI